MNIIRDIVRDYECDAQGIVNNAVYMNYLENARNRYITALGYSLYELFQKGEAPVLAHADLSFKRSLQGGEVYEVHTTPELKGSMRVVFVQDIYRVGKCVGYDDIEEYINHELCVKASMTVAVLHEEKPIPIAQSVMNAWFI